MHNQRLADFNNKFVWVNTNPENIISAPKNALFFRRVNNFYLNLDGNLDGEWCQLPYRTVIIPPPPMNMIIKYKTPHELWVKTTNGFLDDFGHLLPKTGWQFLSHRDVFAKVASSKTFNWLMPPPIATDDPRGSNGSKSYDNNYFYANVSGSWYRTPIAIYPAAEAPGPDNPSLNTNLPFIDLPRLLPVPQYTGYPGILGDQSYDIDFFYVDPSQWRRCMLLMFYNPSKMAVF